MNWERFTISRDRTHHLLDGQPAYTDRFDDVLHVYAPGLAPVLRDGEAWHIHSDGKPAYSRRFSRTFGFYEGRAAVIGMDGWHHINHTGADIYADRYAWCGNFQEQRSPVRDANGLYCHIDDAGCPAYDKLWRYVGDYFDGFAVVQNDEGRSTHIDRGGDFLHDQWFTDLDVFHKNFARARDDHGWTHININGTPIYAHRYAAVEPFYNGQARVERFDGALEVIDETGTQLQELRPPLRSEFTELSSDMVGFWRTQTISTGVSLGIFESLPCTTEGVIAQCGLSSDGAKRILHALAELNLVTLIDAVWQCTQRGSYLQANHPLTLADAAGEYAGPFSRMWQFLPDALRANSTWTAPDVFGEVGIDDRRREGHHRMLRSYALHDYPLVPSALSLCGDETIIDAGGGLGVLAGFILDAYPDVNVHILERPEVVEMAQRDGQQKSGIHFHTQDLFAPWSITASTIILSRILHDLDDDKALGVLENARMALRPGGHLHIIETAPKDDYRSSTLLDLHLLTVTGGRERTTSEYSALLSKADFTKPMHLSVTALTSILTARVK